MQFRKSNMTEALWSQLIKEPSLKIYIIRTVQLPCALQQLTAMFPPLSF